jgi:DNA-binding NtrC family response regulator
MSLAYQTGRELFERGEFGELLRQIAKESQPRKMTDGRLRVLVAHAFALTGDLKKAQEFANLSEVSSISPAVAAEAEAVLGLVGERTGRSTEAIQHYQSALHLAAEAADSNVAAWAQLHLFRFLCEARPIETDAMVPEVRRVVARAGSPTLTAYLHVCLSVIEGQRGRCANARRHCDIAESVSTLSPNAWILANVLVNRGCIAILECNFREAVSLFTQARTIAVQAGLALAVNRADANVGHVQMLRGEFDQARVTLTRLLESFTTTLFRLGALDNLARVELATNSLSASSTYLEELHQTAQQSSLESFYHARWSGLTRARVLKRRGEFLEALDLLIHLGAAASATRDLPLIALVHLTSAEILSRLGKSRAACNELFAATKVIERGSDNQPQYWFGAASVLQERATSLANQLRERALRRWNEHRIVAVRLEMEDAPPEAESTARAASAAKPPLAPAPLTIDCMADSITAAFDLAHSPRLLGAELLAITCALRCSPDAKLVETRLNEPEPISDGITLPLGATDKKKLTLVCTAPTEPAAAVLLGDVLRIGRAALELEKARQEERNRAALWPASPIEEQAGALFLAEEMQTLLATARRIAATNVPILLTGETGTGKEVLARTIHGYSQRSAKTFLPFNCTATPREMLDSQLFGHRRGSFTGATDHFPGVIRAASGGTLLLDEIGETTLEVQPKLLRFLEAGEVHPIGETSPTKVDVRIIAATNADLDALVAQGRFREDLFYRLNIVQLRIPPLRERRVEIPAFANHYLQRHSKEYGKHDLRIAEETMEYLVLYRWPGNVRQLANEMRRMAALAENGALLMPEHLSADIAASRRTIPASERLLEPTEVVVRMDQPLAAAVLHLERAMIQFALTRSGGRMEETAALLGLSRKGLYLKRQRFGLETPQPSDVEFA